MAAFEMGFYPKYGIFVHLCESKSRMGNFYPPGAFPWRSVVSFDTDQRVSEPDPMPEKYNISFIFNGL